MQEKRIIDGVDVSGTWSEFLSPRWVEEKFTFLDEIRKFTGGEEIDKCFQCGTCASLCAVSRVCDKFNPRALINLIRGGYTEDLAQAYLCTLCGRCTKLCPRELDRRKLGIAIREYIVSKNKQPESLNQMREAIQKEHNVANFPNQDRALWAELTEEAPEDFYQREKADVIYFVGCMASFSPAIQDIPAKFAALLERVGENFTILGEKEWCCGYPLFVAGMKSETQELIKHNIEMIKKVGAKKVVFSCPSCYHTFLNEYEIEDVEFLHYTVYIKRLIDEGKVKFKELDLQVAYHDPCDLGRNSGIYEPPREVLKSIVKDKFVELRYSKELGVCCGGGGDVEIVDANIPPQIAERVINIVESSGVDILVCACGQCKRVLGGKKEKKVEIYDFLEFLNKTQII